MRNVESVGHAYALGLAKRRAAPRVCVVDPGGAWLATWKARFKALQIKWLRSPAAALPDAFDEKSLLAYAHSTGRAKTLDVLDSGVKKVKFLA
jgi:hypothetical protein